MRVQIVEKIILENLPSASGIEVFNKKIYIIGDDSPFLYCLDFNFKLLNKITLFKTVDFCSGRIPKHLKPDLEFMTKFAIDEKNFLLTAGSGSRPERDKCFLIEINEDENQFNVQELSLFPLYNWLKSRPEITDNLVLNIEGLVASANHIYFFNRANNGVIIYKLKEFFEFITRASEALPLPEIVKVELEGINGIRAGFSGADIWGGKLFFTSSVEDTDDPVIDGPVLGSFLGWINITDFKNTIPAKIKAFTRINNQTGNFTGKVESVSVYEKISENEYLALCVTDDDLGGSEILRLKIILD